MNIESLDRLLCTSGDLTGRILHVAPAVALEFEHGSEFGWEPSMDEKVHGYLVGSYGFRLPVVVERDWNGTGWARVQ